MQKGFDVLKECCRTLTYMYPFTFYLKQSNQADIFEKNRADLETATEDLIARFENKINGIEQLAGELMNRTSFCDQRRKALLEHCREGYTQQYWAGLDQL